MIIHEIRGNNGNIKYTRCGIFINKKTGQATRIIDKVTCEKCLAFSESGKE